MFICRQSECYFNDKDPVVNVRTKHIDVKFRYVCDLVEQEEIEVEYVATQNQLADIMTKGLARDHHVDMCRRVGLMTV